MPEARGFAPIDAFTDSPRDFRYIWNYQPWKSASRAEASAWQSMAALRQRALREIQRLQ